MATPRKQKKDLQKVGRKEKYKPEYCDLVRKLMKDGKSLAACCSKIGVSRKVFGEWGDRHPEFRAACDAGKEDAQLWWENLAADIASGKRKINDGYMNANTGLIKFLMSRRFPDYYQRRAEDVAPLGGQTGKIVYRSTVRFDGSVIQELMAEEAEGADSPKALEAPGDDDDE